jgi:hypothetical protein
MQTSERQLALGLNADNSHDLEIRRSLDGVVEQRRLANTGLTSHDENTAAGNPRPVDQLIQSLSFTVPSEQASKHSSRAGELSSHVLGDS